MSSPLVSVVMTVYNAERFLKEAIDSILDQSYPHFEFIIIDNASTDRSIKIIEAVEDRRIKLIKNKKNVGQTKALNIGLATAKGKYIARMDADDVALTNRLKRQVTYLEAYPNIAAVGAWCQDIDENGKNLKIYKSAVNPRVIKFNLIGCGDLTEWSMTHPVVTLRREVLDKIGLYKEEEGADFNYPQDYELWRRMVLHGYKLANIPAILLKYRIVKGSESRSAHDLLIKNRLKITRDMVKARDSKLSTEELEALVLMLEYLPQPDSKPFSVRPLMNIFDLYFDSYAQDELNKHFLKRMRDRIKLSYFPIYWKTHKKEALMMLFKIVGSDINAIFDKRVLRKIVKSFVRSLFGYNLMRTLNKTFSSHR